MNSAPPLITAKQKQDYAKKVTILGGIGDFILGVLKIIIGIIFHSHALVVDGIHSFTDVVSDVFVVIIAKKSHEGPDKEHPYGHERFETLGSVVLGSLLIATAGALVYDSTLNLLKGEKGQIPGWPTIVMAFISLLGKEFLFQYTYRAGERLNSSLIKANAWHSRTDAFSSLVVFIGLIFTLFGHVWVDALAAIIVSFIIAKVGWTFVKESIVELADTSASEEENKKIKEAILEVEGVKSCHALRTRKMGSNTLVDVNIEVDLYLTASEAHEIASWTVKVLKDRFSDIKDVTVHTDVEDDRLDGEDNPFEHSFNDLLPLRKEITTQLKEAWSHETIFEEAVAFRLHYINRKVQAEIHLPIEKMRERNLSDPMALGLWQKELHQKAEHLPWFSRVIILFREVGN